MPPATVPLAKAQRATPPADPDDPFSVGTVVDVEIRLYNYKTGYHLVMVDEEGTTETVWHGTDRDAGALLWLCAE
jgi:hypothetical protein